jgi:hypothetical protein
MQILTTEQIEIYNKMRGYDTNSIQNSTTEDQSSHIINIQYGKLT